MSIGYKEQSSASVPTPTAGEMNTFVDLADGKLKRKDSTGSVTNIESVAAGVSTFEGRTGAVVSVAGDYSAAEISSTPSGNIVATNVQDALDELDLEKAPASHVGAGGPSEHPLVTASVAGFMSPSDFTKLAGLPSSFTGNVIYQSTWNASTNAPALVSSVGTKGFYYVVATAGSTNLDGITSWNVGDWAIFNGTVWEKVDNTDAVYSVNGYTGAVVLVKGDVGLGNVDNTSDLNKPISTATQTALNGKEDVGATINQLTGEVTAGPGGGSQVATLSNAAVIAKVLTGLAETYGVVAATDSILQAIQKLTFSQGIHKVQVMQDLTVPTGYVMNRGYTELIGSVVLTIQSGAILNIN
jgi:hypothetical protein